MKQTNLRPTVGHLDPDCEQAGWWKDLTGTLDVPLKSFVPHNSVIEAATGNVAEPFYLVDLTRMPQDQVEELAWFMAMKFRVDIKEVRDGFKGAHGLPIRARLFNSVTFDGRQVL